MIADNIYYNLNDCLFVCENVCVADLILGKFYYLLSICVVVLLFLQLLLLLLLMQVYTLDLICQQIVFSLLRFFPLMLFCLLQKKLKNNYFTYVKFLFFYFISLFFRFVLLALNC